MDASHPSQWYFQSNRVFETPSQPDLIRKRLSLSPNRRTRNEPGLSRFDGTDFPFRTFGLTTRISPNPPPHVIPPTTSQPHPRVPLPAEDMVSPSYRPLRYLPSSADPPFPSSFPRFRPGVDSLLQGDSLRVRKGGLSVQACTKRPVPGTCTAQRITCGMQCAIRPVQARIGTSTGLRRGTRRVHSTRVKAASLAKDTTGEKNRNMVNLGTALLTGGGFGFLLDRAKTDVPLAITEQMAMHHFTMMRMFLGASATSLLVMALLHITGIKERVPRGGLALGLGKCGGYGANVLGGTLLGSGMALTGSCPGTVWAQVGAGLPYVVHIIAGGMLATLVVGYLEKGLLQKVPNYQKRGEPKALDQMLKLPYPAVAVGMAAMMVAVIKVVEMYFPWKVSSALWVAPGAPLASFPPALYSAAWDPLVAGVLLGLLQVPAILTNGAGLGASAGWVYAAGMAAKTCDQKCEENAPYFTRTRSIWQAVAALGMVCGGFVSNYYARASVVGPVLSANAAVGVGSAVSAFCGGFLLLLGSRIANGCTSGHGLTGMATLSISSMITVACMFAGGILTKLLL